jgi:hypothetical protein
MRVTFATGVVAVREGIAVPTAAAAKPVLVYFFTRMA